MFEVKEHNILGWEKYYNIYIKNSGQNSRFITINVNRYISWEADKMQKKIKIDDGKGLKVVKQFKVNTNILMKDL